MVAFIFVLWMILNGKFTLELIFFGALAALIVYLLAHAAFGYTMETERLIYRNVPLILRYFVNLIAEIFIAAVKVVKISWRGKPDPVIIEFHSGLPSSFQNVILANSITLTPGTYTIFQAGDQLAVHCLRPEFAEGIMESSFVHLLRLVRLDGEDTKGDHLREKEQGGKRFQLWRSRRQKHER